MIGVPPIAHKLGDWEYCDSGSGTQTLVLLPGAGGTARSMFSLNTALEPFCRVVSIGLPAKVLSVDQVLEGIHNVMQSLHVKQAVMLGHSLGGMIAPAFAMRYPDKVAGLVLANTGFYLSVRAAWAPLVSPVFKIVPAVLFARLAASKKERLLKGANDAEFWSKFYGEELSQPLAGQRVKSDCILGSQFCLASSLNHPLHIPMQIISSQDDQGFTALERKYLTTLYPYARVKLFSAPTGHLSFLTRPDEYVTVVRRFLDSFTGSRDFSLSETLGT